MAESWKLLATAALAVPFAFGSLFTLMSAFGGGTGTGWTRVFRLRSNPSYQGMGTDLNTQDIADRMAALPPMDHANRAQDWGAKVYSKASEFIDQINNGYLPRMRTKGTDHAVSCRIGWSSNWVNDGVQWMALVGSKCNPPQAALAYDVPPKTAPVGFSAGIAKLQQAGVTHISIGAFANNYQWAQTACDFAMLGANPVSATVDGLRGINLSHFASVSSHFDEPGNMGTFLQNHTTLASQESAIEKMYANWKNIKVAPTAQIEQGILYNSYLGKASYKGSNYPYPPLSWWSSMITKYT